MTPEEKKLIKARKLVDAVNMLARKQGLNFFIVTDGASGISNNGNPAVRNAREAQIKWELEHGADPYEDWSKKAPKAISFPEDEIESLKNRDSIITHRISAERGKYNKGDEVVVPWGDKYVVSDRSDIASVEDSPYKEYLTPEQKKELMKKKIALLTLSKKAESDDDTAKRVYDAIIKHWKRRHPWGLRMSNGKFLDNEYFRSRNMEDFDDEHRKKLMDKGVVYTGDKAVRANRGICHDLASARLKMLSDKGIPATRLFVDYERPDQPSNVLHHSMLYFKDKNGHYHHANRHIDEKENLGDYKNLDEAMKDFIADLIKMKEVKKNEPISIYDNTDVKMPETLSLGEYMRLSRQLGKKIYEQGHEKKASSKKETYESGEGEVESYTPDKTEDHDEIVLRLKNGKRIVISNNTKLGIRVIPAEGDKLGYHGYQIDGTNVVHKVHGNRHQRGGWLEPEKKSMRLYTYLPKENTVDTDGILATALTEDGWKKYQGRTKMKNKDAVLRILDAIEPDWKRSMAISALEQPIPGDAAEDLVQFAKGNRLYSFDLNDLIEAGLVKHIREVNKKHTQEVPGITKHDIDWKRQPGKLLFTGIPHYMIETTNGKIPANLVRSE